MIRPNQSTILRAAAPSLVFLFTVVACGPNPAAPDAQDAAKAQTEGSSADAPSTGKPTDPNALVGYDLRKLRPGERTLAAAFDDQFERAVAEGKRVVVFFSADWCEPCRAIDLELGNQHPAGEIGDVRILELKEEEWTAAQRIDEFEKLRLRWSDEIGSYPMVFLLDARGALVEEMKAAKTRLEAEGVPATLPSWFAHPKR
jgi:hypothetical protein